MTNNLNNRKRSFTKSIIKKEFLNILKNKSLAEITVKEISLAADINRGTFYYYYDDPYALYKEIEDAFISEVLSYITSLTQKNEEWLEKFLELLQKNPDMTIIVLADVNNSNLLNLVLKKVRRDLDESLTQQYAAFSPAERELFFQYFTQGSIAVIKNWLTTYPELSPKKVKLILTDKRIMFH